MPKARATKVAPANFPGHPRKVFECAPPIGERGRRVDAFRPVRGNKAAAPPRVATPPAEAPIDTTQSILPNPHAAEKFARLPGVRSLSCWSATVRADQAHVASLRAALTAGR